MSFAADCEKFRRKSFNARMNVVVRKVSLDLFKKVVEKTPVDTGRARGNWMVGINHLPIGSSITVDNNPMSRIVADISRAAAGDTVALVNTLPYIGVLEYGGFPNPPKKGSRVKGKGWQIKSAGGYSKQSPQGMVRTTVEEYKPTLNEAIAYAKGLTR